MGFEVDPSDGLPTFMEVYIEGGYEINSLSDVSKLFQGLFEAATAASLDVGFQVYPIWVLDGKS